MTKVTQNFQAEVSQVLKLVINSLYSNRDIFLRELISNASDALDKLRFEAIQKPELLDADQTLKVRLLVDEAAGTLTISDNGIGMTPDELKQNLGTIAWSGSREFLEKLQAAKDGGNLNLIGQFGVGFYSAYLVADRVEVLSRAAGSTEAARWESTGQDSFSIEAAERPERGTSVILHLKPEHREYLSDFKLRDLVARYSDYIAHSIELGKREKEDEAPKYEVVNRASALWQRSPKEVKKEQYEEFYKHLSHDWEPPLAHKHFRIEGTQLFTGLLFLPKRPPFDLFDPEPKHGVRLHVKRVFVMENCEELVPRWLRFVRGVVDSEDLPLNVSRELLQDSKAVKVIRKQIVNQSLDMLEELAKEKPEEYTSFWKSFGAVIKEGLHFEPSLAERMTRLLRYESSERDGLVSLEDYVARMPETQSAIYYATGESLRILRQSPHLEQLRKRGYEVLLMADPVDPFVMSTLTEYAKKPFVSAGGANLDLESDDAKSDADKQAKPEQASPELAPLLERFQRVLEKQVSEVRVSKRLADSPACLVVPEGGLAPHIERMLRARQLDVPPAKRILEINPEHSLIKNLTRLNALEAGSDRVREWIELVYDQALLSEGSPVDDPAALAQRMARLMTQAAAAATEPVTDSASNAE